MRKTHQVKPLSMRAALNSVNPDKRTVDVVFSTGAKVLRSSWIDGQFWEELDMSPGAVRLDRLNNGAPFLMDHNGYDVANTPAVVESARIEGGKGYASVRFAKPGIDPEADMLFAKIQDGIVRSVSVGYRVHKVEKIQIEGEKIPTMRVVDWTPYEISAVAMPADAGAGFRHADQTTNELEIVENRSSTPEESDTMFKRRKLQEQENGNGGGGGAPAVASAPAPVNTEEIKRAAVQAERERAAGIMHAVRAAKLDDGKLGEKMIADGVTVDAARAQVLDLLVQRDAQTPTDNHGAHVTGVEGGDERDKWVRGMSAAMFVTFGAASDVLRAHERAVKGELRSAHLAREFKGIDLDGGQFRTERAFKISDIARIALDRRGVSHRGIYDPVQVIQLALRASTGDFAVLFENVMYKTLRAAYAVQEDTWRRWCGTDTVKDFRAANRFLNGAFSGALPVVPEDAEYTHRSIPDGEKVSISTETRGQIISLSRQAMINDDMGALIDVAARFGRQAGKSIEIAAYELLALNTNLGPTMSDSSPFYDDTARANVSTTAALSVAAIDADRIKFRQQTFGDDYLDLRPSILLLPVGLESAARIINEDAYDHSTGTNNNVPNPVRGLFADIVSSPRLVSTTRRFLFDPSKSAFKVVFLEGSGEGPTMQSEEGFNRDGIQWKARIDFKVNPYDPRTTVTNAG